MGNFLSKIFASGIGELATGIGNLVGQFKLNPGEKAQLSLELQKLVAEREKTAIGQINTEIDARMKVMVAELSQGDAYTKRARPTLAYAGLVAMAVNHVILPWVTYLLGKEIPVINLPTEFWLGWSGVVATWSIGRTMEKRGNGNKVTTMITGNSLLK